jgi:Abnormal spindle-like microcephaly-assoc'd, ASPM-SPD-2-Hydin/Glycosyl hydrolase family 12
MVRQGLGSRLFSLLVFLLCFRASTVVLAQDSPPPGSCTLSTTDSALNLGKSATNDYTALSSAQPTTVTAARNSRDQLWLYYPNPYDLSSGSGTIDMSYTGKGVFSWNVSLSGLNNTFVNAFPNIQYGRDAYSGGVSDVEGQPPQFPVQLSTLSSLPVDTAYSLTGTITGSRDIDVLFDQWVSTQAGASITNVPSSTTLEVGVFPYFSFDIGYDGSLVKTFVEPVTLNGSSTNMSFYEYSANGGFSIFFYAVPGQEVASGEIAFDMLDFLNEAVKTSGNSGYDWLQAETLGTEFGENADQNFSFEVTKFAFQQVPLTCPPIVEKLTVSPKALTFGSVLLDSKKAKPVTIRNSGNRKTGHTVNIGAVSSSLPDFNPISECGSLPPSATCKIEVTFTPTGTAAENGMLTIDTDAAGGPLMEPISGTGKAPKTKK